MRHILTSTAVVATLLIACGKDEPAPTPPPAAPTAAEPGKPGAAKDESGMGNDNLGGKDKLAEDPSRSAAPTPAPSTPLPPLTPAAAPPERGPLTPTSIATFPADVVAVAGTPSLKALVDAFAVRAREIKGVPVPPDPVAMALQQLQQRAGVDLSWLDLEKPLRIAVPDPKKFVDGFVVLLPLKAGATVDAKAIPGATEGGGHLLTVKLGDKTLFLDKGVDGHLVATSHDELAKVLGAFVNELAAWTPKDPLVLDTSVENLVRIYADELKKLKEMVGAFASGMAQDPAAAEQLGPLMAMAGQGFALVEGTARIGLSVDPSGDFPRFTVALKGLPSSPLDAMAKDLATRRLELISAIPADAWFAIDYDVPGSHLLSDAKRIVESITQSGQAGPMRISWTDEERAKLTELLTRAFELHGDEAAMWLRQEGTLAFILETVSDSKDGKAMQAAFVETGDFLYRKVFAEGRKAYVAAGAPGNQLPEAMTFKDFAALVSKQVGAMGFGLSVNEAATKGGQPVGGLELKLDWSRLPIRGAGPVGDLIGDRVGLALGGEGKLFAAAIGPDAATRVARVLDDAAAVSAPTDPWLALAKDQSIFAMFRPARLFRALVGVVPDLAPMRDVIGQLGDDPAVLRGQSDGVTIQLEGTVPIKVIVALVAATMR